MGKRYRIADGEKNVIGKVLVCQKEHEFSLPPNAGHIDHAQVSTRCAWFAVNEAGYGGWVTAVELVDEPEQAPDVQWGERLDDLCANCRDTRANHAFHSDSECQEFSLTYKPDPTCRNWLRAEVASLTAERDAALSKVAELEAERSTWRELREAALATVDSLSTQLTVLQESMKRERTHLADLSAARETIARLEGELGVAKASALLELASLATVKKWVAAGEVSKEAAWGRAYLAASRELLDKYRAAPVAPVEPRAIVVGSVWARGGIQVNVVSTVAGVQFKRVGICDGFDYEDVTTREFRETYSWVSDPEPTPSTGGEL